MLQSNNPLQTNSLSTFYDLVQPDQPSFLHAKIHILNNNVEGALIKYSSSKDPQEGHDLLIGLETRVNNLFEHYKDYPFEEADVEQLTALCRRMNEDPVFQEIREAYSQLVFQREQMAEKEKQKKARALQEDREQCVSKSNAMSQEKLAGPSENRDSVVLGSTVPSLESTDKNSPIPSMEIKEEESKNIEGTPQDNQRKSFNDQSLNIMRENGLNLEPVEDSKESPQKGIQQLFMKMKEQYEKHFIDSAYEILQEINRLATTQQSPELQALIQQNMPLMQEIDMFHQFCTKILSEMEDEHGYHLEKVKNNFEVKYKSIKGERLGLKMEGIVNVPLFNFLALVNENEGYTKWMPFCSQAHLVKKINRASQCFYIKCSLPPPISGREMTGFGAGFDRLEQNGSILLVSKSIDTDYETQKRLGLNIPAKSKTTKMEMEYMGVELYPIGPTQTKMKMVLKFDPRIKYLPLSFINWHVKKLGHIFVDRIVSRATNFKGSLWEKKIQENQDLYGLIQEKIDQYLQKQGKISSLLRET